jgi:hypothetical protein
VDAKQAPKPEKQRRPGEIILGERKWSAFLERFSFVFIRVHSRFNGTFPAEP